MKASIVIPTYNREKLLEKCITLLFEQTCPKTDYEIVVVDDGSLDGTEQLVKKLQGSSPVKLKYLKQKNRGPAAARNLGIKNSKGNIIAFTDDDCLPDKNWLNNIIKPFNDEDIAGVEGRVIMEGEKTPFTRNIENLEGGKYITACMAYRKNILESVGFFNESFPYPEFEDTDLAYRVLGQKKRIEFCEKAVVFHPNEERSIKSILKKVKYMRSLIVLKEKNNEMYKSIAGKKLINDFVFVVFIRPFSLNHWKYLILNPSKISKYIFMCTIDDFSYIYLGILLCINALKNHDRTRILNTSGGE
jgi:glycosyltransferase involved in cell wall biosynthesis